MEGSIKCTKCGSTDIAHADSDSWFDPETGEGDDYYGYCECMNCGRRTEGWDGDECIDLFKSVQEIDDGSFGRLGAKFVDLGRDGIQDLAKG